MGEKSEVGEGKWNQLAHHNSAAADIETVLDAFKLHLQARGNTSHYVKTTVRQVRDLLETIPSPVSERRLEGAIGQLLEWGKSRRTCNSYLISVRSFFRWAHRQQLVNADVAARLQPYRQDKDRRHTRISFTDAELQALLSTTEASAKTWKMIGGRERAALYRAAAWTGLRAGTLRVLTVDQFRLTGEVPHVHVRGDQVKSGRDADIPIHPLPAAALARFFAGSPPDSVCFHMPPPWDVVKMFRADLAVAGLNYCERRTGEDGRTRRLAVRDFHSLRRTFGTGWLRRGVPLTTVQQWMQHSSPNLTANLYNDVALRDAAKMFRELPPICGS